MAFIAEGGISGYYLNADKESDPALIPDIEPTVTVVISEIANREESTSDGVFCVLSKESGFAETLFALHKPAAFLDSAYWVGCLGDTARENSFGPSYSKDDQECESIGYQCIHLTASVAANGICEHFQSHRPHCLDNSPTYTVRPPLRLAVANTTSTFANRTMVCDDGRESFVRSPTIFTPPPLIRERQQTYA
jgi:hypothetical protein